VRYGLNSGYNESKLRLTTSAFHLIASHCRYYLHHRDRHRASISISSYRPSSSCYVAEATSAVRRSTLYNRYVIKRRRPDDAAMERRGLGEREIGVGGGRWHSVWDPSRPTIDLRLNVGHPAPDLSLSTCCVAQQCYEGPIFSSIRSGPIDTSLRFWNSKIPIA